MKEVWTREKFIRYFERQLERARAMTDAQFNEMVELMNRMDAEEMGEAVMREINGAAEARDRMVN